MLIVGFLAVACYQQLAKVPLSKHAAVAPLAVPCRYAKLEPQPHLHILTVILQEHADYIDLNLGCPQRIAKRGFYGAFLMDDLQLIEQLVTAAASRLAKPVSCKIRLFPDISKTIEYARMLQAAGCSLLAVHGRLRECKVCWE